MCASVHVLAGAHMLVGARRTRRVSSFFIGASMSAMSAASRRADSVDVTSRWIFAALSQSASGGGIGGPGPFGFWGEPAASPPALAAGGFAWSALSSAQWRPQWHQLSFSGSASSQG